MCEAFDGTLTLLYKGQPLDYRILMEGEPPVPLADEKRVAEVVYTGQGEPGALNTVEAAGGSSVAALSGDDRDPSWMKTSGLDRCLPGGLDSIRYAHFVQPTGRSYKVKGDISKLR